MGQHLAREHSANGRRPRVRVVGLLGVFPTRLGEAISAVGPPASLAVSCFREPRQGRFTPLRCVPRRLRRWPCGPPLTRPAPARGRSERAARRVGGPGGVG